MLLIQNNTTPLPIHKCCELLDVNRSNVYYNHVELSTENTDLMNTIYEIWSEYPFYGYRKITAILQNSGLKVLACTEKTKNSIYQMDLKEPLAIIMGSEEDGISDEIIRKSDDLAVIPQSGQVGSLNVSVAAGVIIYETIRQRSL